jgi:hypothetical protein
MHRAGKTYDESYGQAVFGPGLPPSTFPWAFRIGDDLGVSIPMFTDLGGNGGYSLVDSAATRLYRGDGLVGETTEPGFGEFPGLPAENSKYRLTTELTRSAPFDVATAISAEWTFKSAHVDGEEPAAVPLNTVHFTPVLDDANSARAGKPFLVPLVLQDETGAYSRPKKVTVEASYDEGKTWQRVPVLINLVAKLDHPAGAESVSLRVSASDRDGNTVKETLIRAYKLRK